MLLATNKCVATEDSDGIHKDVIPPPPPPPHFGVTLQDKMG